MGFTLLLQIGRIVLGITNFVFVLIGFALFLFGLLVKYGDNLGSYYENVISSLETSLSGPGFPNSNLDFDLGELAESLSTSLILSGTMLLIIAVVAIIANVSKKRCLLLLYSVVLIVFITAQLITLCIFYRKPALITDPVKDGLKSSIQSEYQGFNGTNFESIAWNFINQKGCFNKLWDIVIGNPAITAPVISLCLLMQTLFLATTIVLLKRKATRSEKSDQETVT